MCYRPVLFRAPFNSLLSTTQVGALLLQLLSFTLFRAPTFLATPIHFTFSRMDTLPLVTPDNTLTERELRFVAEYVAEPNGTRAYMRAFGNPNYSTAATSAKDLLKKPHIRAEIAAARRAWVKQCRVSFQRTIRTLANIAFADTYDLYEPDPENNDLPKPRPWSEVPPHARKLVESVRIKRRKLKTESGELYEIEEIEYRTTSREWALNKLCDYLGITKGTLTVEDLRAILFGTHPAPTPITAGTTPSGVQKDLAGSNSTAVLVLHPDE